jgi:hypothetical protein
MTVAKKLAAYARATFHSAMKNEKRGSSFWVTVTFLADVRAVRSSDEPGVPVLVSISIDIS